MTEITYPNEVQEFYYETLEWCGCGNPDEALAFMRDVLQVIHDRSKDNSLPSERRIPYAQSKWAKHTAKLNAMLPGALGLSYLYMLSALGLTEHGGSVGGSWLTIEGDRVLSILANADLEEAMSSF